jgi:hypothetical protein
MKISKLISIALVLSIVVMTSCGNDDKSTESVNAKSQIETTTKINESEYSLWTEIGVLEDGVPVITADKLSLITAVNRNHIKTDDFNPEVNSVFIDVMEDTYYLTFRGKESKVTFYVQLSKNSTLLAAGGTSCSSKDCSQEQLGCIPSYPNNPSGEAGL